MQSYELLIKIKYKQMKGTYLITTDNWFFAPDGKQYRSAWGKVEVLGDSMLGIKTNARSANWFIQVGSTDKGVIIAGCQVHYAVICEEKPNIEPYVLENVHEGKTILAPVHTRIYIAQ